MTTYNESTPYMKSAFCTIICLTALGLTLALAQEPSPPPPVMPPRSVAPAPAPPPGGQFSERLQNIIQRASAPPPAEPSLTKFNFDFPAGTPRELVAALEKAMGRQINVIIPDEYGNTKLPAFKMTNVTFPELFQAIGQVGRVMVDNASYSKYSFTTQGKPTDDSIWYFYANKAPGPTKVCRFYPLAPFVDRGMSVDDITTAIETGWKMLGETSPPTISFHKDTKLLIAVGEPSKLETIDAVLKALEPPRSFYGGYPQGIPVYAVPPPVAKPAEKPKNEK
jgi:hypothetical protein